MLKLDNIRGKVNLNTVSIEFVKRETSMREEEKGERERERLNFYFFGMKRNWDERDSFYGTRTFL
jgi:hypothetical protein